MKPTYSPTDVAWTEEQIVAHAESVSVTSLGMRRIINRVVKNQTKDSAAFNKARRRVNKVERANGEMSPLEYAYALNYEIGNIVNSNY